MAAPPTDTGPVVIVFAKAPIPGEVKTRLQPEVSSTEAVELYRAMVEDVVSNLRGFASDATPCGYASDATPRGSGSDATPRGSGDGASARRPEGRHLAIFFAPDGSESEFLRWFPGLQLVPQAGHDLGERMLNAFEWARERGHDRAIIVGTDLPTLSAAVVDEALTALSSADVVLGPCSDGGYYLVGAREPHPALFRGFTWSTSDVLEGTLARAEEFGLSVCLLSEERDIDTYDDVLVLRAGLSDTELRARAPRTGSVLESLLERENERT